MLLFSIVVAVILYGLAAPDPWTLRTTRGAAGAIRATRSDRPATRSGTRSNRPATTRSDRPRSTRSDRVTRSDRPPDPTRSPSLIARAIHGWIGSADRAERRRGEAIAAVRQLRDRVRSRRLAKQNAAAWDLAHAENERRDRAEQRARFRAGLADATAALSAWREPETAEKKPPSPPATPASPNGASVPDIRDTNTHVTLSELATLKQAWTEVSDARRLAGALFEAVRGLAEYLANFPERYDAATDLYKTGQMNASVALLKERQIGHMEIEIGKVHSQLSLLARGIENAEGVVRESDAKTGRVESALPT